MVLYSYFCRERQLQAVGRHADRQEGADVLTAAGNARAEALANALEAGISAIYTSEAVRTQQTAAPTASLLGITPVAVAASDVASLVSTIRSDHYSQRCW